jgi:hypothetical protein
MAAIYFRKFRQMRAEMNGNSPIRESAWQSSLIMLSFWTAKVNISRSRRVNYNCIPGRRREIQSDGVVDCELFGEGAADVSLPHVKPSRNAARFEHFSVYDEGANMQRIGETTR